MVWAQMKLLLVELTGLGKDALHVHLALFGQILVALIFRKWLGHPLPWLAVLAAAVANEISDLHTEIWPVRADQYRESFHDLWNSMVVPTLILVLCRLLPGLFQHPKGQDEKMRLESGDAPIL